MEKLVFRLCRESDRNAILAFDVDLDGQDYLPTYFKVLIHSKKCHLFVGCLNNQVVTFKFIIDVGENMIYKGGTRVHKEFRGRGFHKQLDRYVFEEIIRRYPPGTRRIYSAENNQAQRNNLSNRPHSYTLLARRHLLSLITSHVRSPQAVTTITQPLPRLLTQAEFPRLVANDKDRNRLFPDGWLMSRWTCMPATAENAELAFSLNNADVLGTFVLDGNNEEYCRSISIMNVFKCPKPLCRMDISFEGDTRADLKQHVLACFKIKEQRFGNSLPTAMVLTVPISEEREWMEEWLENFDGSKIPILRDGEMWFIEDHKVEYSNPRKSVL